MKNIIHFFDLDGTLWKTDAMWWVVDKHEPHQPLVKITQEEGALTCAGYYKNAGNMISYNGIEGWLSAATYKKVCAKKKYKLEDLGLSFREFNMKEFLDQQAENLTFLIEHIEHLKDSKDTIALLTARGSREQHDKMITKLKEQMDEHKLGLDIEKIYFVNDYTHSRHEGLTHDKKAYILLEHIVGYRIKDHKFIPVQQESYDEVHFYDDEEKNIEACLDANKYIKAFLARTDESFAAELTKDLTERKVKFHVHKTTSNRVNPFTSNTIEIKP